MKKGLFLMGLIVLLVFGLIGCLSSPTTQNDQTRTQQRGESQVEKWQRLYLEDNEKLVIGSDNRATIESIEAVFQPQVITRISEITSEKLIDPGRPYYFKIQAIYKGYDKNSEKALLQDIGEKQANVLDAALGTIFGGNTDVNYLDVFGGDVVASTFPTEANSIATFYLVVGRFSEHQGRRVNETTIFIRFARNIERPLLNPSNFVVASGMRYITVNDARVITQQDVMMNMMSGGAISNRGNVFDPIIYPLVDLMDARVAMNRKDYRNEYTFPTVRERFVSEVIFRGQSNTTITVSTNDNVLTERMNFTGRASNITNGQRIRVYFTIAKDPLEIWEIQAIERL